MNNCPEISTLISYALNPDSKENAEIAAHVFDCPDCQKNLEIIHETMLADKWSNPRPKGKPEGDVVADGNPAVENQGDDQESCAAYVFTATKDMRDRFGVMSIPAGEKYLKDPKTNEVELLTPESKRRFVESGFSFYRQIAGSTEERVARAGADANRFFDEIDLNMAGLRGMLIPDCNLTIRQKINPFAMTFKDVRTCCDTAKKGNCEGAESQWLRALRNGGVIPAEDVLTKTVESSVASANRFRVYELVRGRIKFRVFAAFVTPVGKDANACAATLSDAKCIRDFADSWNAHHPDSDVRCLCYTFAAANGWDENCRSSASSSSIMVYSWPDAKVKIGWRVSEPDVVTKRPVFTNFVCALYPESMESQRILIEKALETRKGEGDVEVEEFARVHQLPLGRVLRAFEELRKKDIGWGAVGDKCAKYPSLAWKPKKERRVSFLANSLTANVYLVQFWCSFCVAFATAICVAFGAFCKNCIASQASLAVGILIALAFFVVKFCIDYLMRDAIRRIER